MTVARVPSPVVGESAPALSSPAESALSGFAVESDAVWNAMHPFVSRTYEPGDPGWALLCRKYRKQVNSDRLRRLFRFLTRRARQRTQAEIEQIYSERWSHDQFKPFAIPAQAKGGSAYDWDGKGLRLANAGARRVRILYLMRLIAALRPDSVLEIGFGEGVNLALLAARFPQTGFAGIELTEGGVAAARMLQQFEALPAELIRFSPEPLPAPGAHRAIDFRLGSAAKLPWPDGSFDLVFTSLALEQMEQVRHAALSEIARVTRRYTAMIEPFFEVNNRGLRRRYMRTYDYFQGSIADLASYGLTPMLVRDDLPAKITLKPAFVVCRKTGPSETTVGRRPVQAPC